MRETGLEPAPRCRDQDLNLACLPIPPLARIADHLTRRAIYGYTRHVSANDSRGRRRHREVLPDGRARCAGARNGFITSPRFRMGQDDVGARPPGVRLVAGAERAHDHHTQAAAISPCTTTLAFLPPTVGAAARVRARCALASQHLVLTRMRSAIIARHRDRPTSTGPTRAQTPLTERWRQRGYEAAQRPATLRPRGGWTSAPITP